MALATSIPAQLELLGGAWLCVAGKRERLERKAAGLLAYLAFEGAQPRSTLAGLLWSDVIESRAKGNLRQCLYKLKQTIEVIQGDEMLSLNRLEVDAVRLENGVLVGDYAPLTVLQGELLSGYAYDDCPDFEDWLYRTRQRWVALRRTAFREQIQSEKAVNQKLELAQAWLDLEPLSEQALHTLVNLLLEAQRPLEARAAIDAFEVRHQREYNEPATHLLAWLVQPRSETTPQGLLEQANTAKTALQHEKASSFMLQAADAFATRGELAAECDALLDAAELMSIFDQTERLETLLERIAGLARTPKQVLRWRSQLMNRAYAKAEWQRCLREAERVVGLAARLEDQATILDAKGFIAAVYMELGELNHAVQGFEEILKITRETGNLVLIHGALNNLAFARNGQGRVGECLALMTEALEIAEAIGDVPQQLVYLNQLTFYAKTALGRSEALQFAGRGLALHRHITGQEEQRIKNLGFLGELKRDAGLYDGALEAIGLALAIGIEKNMACTYLHRMNASVFLQLGALTEAAAELERGFARADSNTTDLMSLTVVKLRLQRWQGLGKLEAVEDSIAAWQDSTDHGFMRRLQIERSYYLHGLERVEFLREILGQPQGFAMFFLALAWLEAGEPQKALPITSSLIERLETFDPNDLYTPEILLTHAQTLSALEHPDAQMAWQNARAWAEDKASHHVPSKFKQGFLEQHPINRMLLEKVETI